MQEYQVAIKIAVDRINATKETANAFKQKYKHFLRVKKRQKLKLELK